MVKSYIKIYGPPLSKALRALEKIAVELPEVSFYNTLLTFDPYVAFNPDRMDVYLQDHGMEVSIERKEKIISKSGVALGEYDFFFEWSLEPDWKQVEDLIQKIDENLKPLGCLYTITTK